MELHLRYDMNSPPFGAPHPVLYRTAIEQAAWADRLGFHSVYLAEHHGAEHGYCPSPMIHAASILGVTEQIKVHLSALVVTMHDPLRLAEDLSVLDNLSNGRIMLTAGMGYRPHEFAMFGKDITRKLSLLNEALDVFKKAWTGEPFEYHGRTVRVTPKPVQPGGPKIYMGGSTEKSAARAGRSGYQFRPAHPTLWPIYTAARAEAGFPEPEPYLKSVGSFFYVSDDPDRDWPLLAPHIGYATNTYAEWAKERGSGSTMYQPAQSDEELRKLPIFKILTPDRAFDDIKSLGPDSSVGFHALMGGLDPELSWKSLKLFEKAVYPRLITEGLFQPQGREQLKQGEPA
jgi:alkanesulfonate monooxygenase SsuD/methylene tetrahydromethanopterin reductase-like flavin-dependent oxidoreductase (luciferase family)